MPSTATITAFYNFSANTKARASQVNGNFDIFRGHIIPVEVLTATSANNTYDLGSNEYNWRNVYARSYKIGSTSTGFSIEAATTTAEQASILKNNTVVYTFSAVGQTTSANYSQIGISNIVGATATDTDFLMTSGSGTFSFLTICSLSIKTSGQPIAVSFTGVNGTVASARIGYVLITSNTTTGIDVYPAIRRNNNLISGFLRTGASTNTFTDSNFNAIDFPGATTSCNYDFGVFYGTAITAGSVLRLRVRDRMALYAKEIF